MSDRIIKVFLPFPQLQITPVSYTHLDVYKRQDVSFGGTSIIIVVGVVLESIKQVESQMLVRNYKGFLND